jgi:hypothetical protein
MKVHAAKEYDDTPQESRQQWTSLDEGKGEDEKNSLRIICMVTQPVLS